MTRRALAEESGDRKSKHNGRHRYGESRIALFGTRSLISQLARRLGSDQAFSPLPTMVLTRERAMNDSSNRERLDTLCGERLALDRPVDIAFDAGCNGFPSWF